MSFSPEALDFLVENQFHDSRSWYHEHKDFYKEKVVLPFVELIDGLQPTFDRIDSRIECSPRRISRLYRDARRCRGKSIFRDSVWCSFHPSGDKDNPLPGFYFEISPRGFDFGCGYYIMPADVRDELRRRILDGDPLFGKALAAYEKQSTFKLYGELYKRNHYPDRSEKECDWLNRKCIGMSAASTDFDLLFSDNLLVYLSGQYLSLRPFWNFLMSVEEQVRSRRF